MKARRRCAIRVDVAATIVAVMVSIGSGASAKETSAITIATGRVGGIYHPVGGAICKLVNDQRDEHGITCTVEISDGSVGNIRELRDGEVQLALAQSDWQHDAYEGVGVFADRGAFTALRSVFAIYVESFTAVARRDLGTSGIAELKGRRVYSGPPGSGSHYTLKAVMNALGWPPDAVVDVPEFKAQSQAEALCDNEFDAFVSTTGHPNPQIREALAVCRADILPVPDAVIDKLVKAHPYYVASVIPQGTYTGLSKDIRSLGLVATLVTTADVPDEIIYRVTAAFFDNLDRLREASPLLRFLSARQMTEVGLTAPLHDGAARYFSEAGLK